MASIHHGVAASLDTPITIKIVFEGSNRKFKLPLQELSVHLFSEKIRSILQIPENQRVLLERFSDSGNAYIALDQANPSAYKQLFRAAKAKGKLRIRATIIDDSSSGSAQEVRKREQPTPEPSAQPLAARLAAYPYSIPQSGHRSCEIKSMAPKDMATAHARDEFFHHLANLSRERAMGRRMKEAPTQTQTPSSAWQIFCNNCDKSMDDAHFHCSVCDGGDYDLCEECVENGKTCSGEGHWLVKRFIKSGKVVSSTTERIMPKSTSAKAFEQDIPGAFLSEAKIEDLSQEPSRTCNSCVRVLPENALVTCKDCPDYDLCVPCVSTKHGHHPGHAFEPTVAGTTITAQTTALCAPGRNTRHYAICDGCDKTIVGVRHKCLICPDWDFCDKCIDTAKKSHAGHRFVPVYTTLDVPASPSSLHYGIFCDGPLCSGKPGQSYIKGIRFKCAICHDMDFCANCEAHPSNKHNETHPLIKFKTPVRGASITTVESKPNHQTTSMGDRSHFAASAHWAHRASSHMMAHQNTSTTTLPPYTPTLETQRKVENDAKAQEELAIKSVDVKQATVVPSTELDAHFVHDIIADGTKFKPTTGFTQIWTLKNPGPHAWPVGCTVSHTGGDNMLRIDRSRPTTLAELTTAQRSNATARIVEVGDQYDFAIPMRTPAREGKYISYWRMKAPDGTPFGHKLWCDVEVATPSFTSIRQASSMALADHQMQLMLLEQQNKKRLMMARHELDMKEKNQRVVAEQAQETKQEELVPAVAPTSASEASVEKLDETVPSEDLESSTMVFPTLEKESPTSSTYQDATSAAPSAGISEVAALDSTADTTSETETEMMTATPAEETFEDLESVEFEESDEEDDGFMTDEEYDILDASDEEVLSRVKKSL